MVSRVNESPRRHVRVLIGADDELAERLVAALEAAPTWTFEIDVVHPTTLTWTDTCDLYLVDASTLDPHVTRGDPTGERPLIAVCPDMSMSFERARAAGAVDLIG